MTAIAGERTRTGWLEQVLWVLGGLLGSAVLANGCIALGAGLALVLVTQASRPVGVAINVVAFAAMIAGYAYILSWLLGALRERRAVPEGLWVGLALFPVLWGALMATAPQGLVAVPPLVVTAVGGAVAAFVVGRRASLAQAR